MTSRASRAIVAFALISSLLVVASVPAAASHGPVVVSAHDTASDFNSGTLTNLTVNGSGDSATVEGVIEETRPTVDDFEDNDISEYSGSTGRFSTQSGTVQNGTYALAAGTNNNGGSNSILSTSGLDTYPEAGERIIVYSQRAQTGSGRMAFRFAVQDSNNYYSVFRDYANGETTLRKSDGGSVTTLDTVGTDGGGGWDSFTIHWNEEGTITVDLSYTGTNLTATDSTFTEGGIAFYTQIADVNDGGTDGYFDNVTVVSEESTLPGEYKNNHSATNTVRGFVNVTTADNVSITTTYRGDSDGDGSYDTLLNQTTGITSAANHSFTWSEFSGDDVRLNLTVESTGSSGNFVLEDEGVKATAVAPAVNNSTATPTGQLTEVPGSLEIEVSDEEFSLAQGDSVDVEFFTNTSGSVGTDTLTANGTASASISTPTESVKWWAVATDDAGHSTRSQNFTFQPPAELSVYNETAVRINGTRTSDELVDEVEVEIRMLQDDGSLTIVTRTATNGVIDMSGLDPTQPFVAVATADTYHNRRIFVESLYDAQAIYLLPESQTSVTQNFDLQDFSGLFPDDDTVLEIQRALNGSWRTVEGDYFGATGEFSATLRYNARHRLVLKNIETGRTKVVGTYTPIESEDKIVKVTDEGEVSLIVAGVDVAFDPSIGSLEAASTTVDVTISDEEDDLSAYNVTAYLNNESGNFTLDSATGSSATGETLSLSLDLVNETGNVTVVAEWSTSSTSGSETEIYLIRESFGNEYSLLAVLGTIPTYLPAATAGIFLAGLSILLGILAVVVSASAVRLSTEEAGLAGVTTLALTAMIGWLDWSVVFATAVVWVALAARRRGF